MEVKREGAARGCREGEQQSFNPCFDGSEARVYPLVRGYLTLLLFQSLF